MHLVEAVQACQIASEDSTAATVVELVAVVEAEQDLREMEPTVLAVVLDPTQLQTREQAEAEDHKEIPDTPAAMVAQAI